MELIYLYIKKYKKIEEKEITFNHKYNVKKQTKDNRIELIIEENSEIYFNDYGKNILNITGIIGMNGSGKTLLLELIEKIFINQESSKKYKDMEVVYVFLSYDDYKLKIKGINLDIISNDKNEYFYEDKNENVVIFSNKEKNKKNINNFLLNYKLLNNKALNLGFENDLKVNINGIGKSKNEIEEYLVQKYKRKALKGIEEYGYLDDIPEMKKKLEMINLKKLERFKNFRIFRSDYEYAQVFGDIWISKYILEDINFYETFKKIKKYLSLVDENIDGEAYIKKENWEKLSKYLGEYPEILLTVIEEIEYSFKNPLSSGEEIICLLYSGLISKEQNELILEEHSEDNYYRAIDKFLILLDEPECSLHIEWQRTFLNDMLDILNNQFDDVKIQIIIATHSPFIVSDLFRENLVFLDDNRNNFQRTFGSNILSLLKNSFFLESTISEYSRNKIREISEKLEEDKGINPRELKIFSEIIDRVEDDLIRNYLKELYFKKINDISKIDNEINKLENKILELKEKKKKLVIVND